MHISCNVRHSDVGKVRRIATVAAAGSMLLFGIGFGSSTSMGQAVATTTVSGQPAYAAALQTEIERAMKANVIPGAIVLIKSRDKGDWRATLGTAEIGKTAPLSLADSVRIGS